MPKKPTKPKTTLGSKTCKSNIEKYKLEEMIIQARSEGLSYQEIADKCNESGLVPAGVEINLFAVQRFLKKVPEVQKNLLHQDKRRLLKVMNRQIDIIDEVIVLYNRTKNLLLSMEKQAADSKSMVSAKSYKQLASEMRALLKQMTDIQKELNDFENVKKFMEIVMETVQDVAPDAMPKILDKLRIRQNSVWVTKKLSASDNIVMDEETIDESEDEEDEE